MKILINLLLLYFPVMETLPRFDEDVVQSSVQLPKNCGANFRNNFIADASDVFLDLRKKRELQFTNNFMGSELTDIDEFPWVAILIYNSSFHQIGGCGGSLISNKYILTAAHCVTGDRYIKNGGLKSIRLGEYDTQNDITQPDCIYGEDDPDCADEPIDVPYEEIIIHPDYDVNSKAQHNDIALIRLRETVKLTSFINSICIPLKKYNSEVSAGDQLSVAGWGKTDIFQERYGIIFSPIKLKSRVPYIDDDHCSQQQLQIGPGQLCAGRGKYTKDAYQDGSPLMKFDRSSFRWILIGIVSLGFEYCSTEGVPCVHTKVNHYTDWILNNIRN